MSKLKQVQHYAVAVRCVLKRCSLGVPLKASIDKNANAGKVPVHVKASCLGEGLCFLMCDPRQSQLGALELTHYKLEMIQQLLTWLGASPSKGVGEEVETSFICNWTFHSVSLSLSLSLSQKRATEKQLAGHRSSTILTKRTEEPFWVWRSSRERQMSSELRRMTQIDTSKELAVQLQDEACKQILCM